MMHYHAYNIWYKLINIIRYIMDNLYYYIGLLDRDAMIER